MNVIHRFLFGTFIYIFIYFQTNTAVRIPYVALERPQVTFYDTQYMENLTVSSRRYSRKDPSYYLVIETDLLQPFGDNVTMSFDLRQVKNNRYTLTLFGFRDKICDFVEKHNIFGESLLKSLGNRTCPYQPGFYHFNLTVVVSSIPKYFPYKQGRMFVNVSVNSHGKDETVIAGYLDLEIRTLYKKN